MKAFCLSLIVSAAAAAAAAGIDQTLYARQTTALEVDFTEFPACASVCLTRWRALSCPTNPPTLSCFCSLPSPLSCAISAESACWSSAESWYATQCPSVPAVNTTAIPTCAQSCFEKENTHCVNDLTRNCVCSWGQPDCAGGCTKDDATLWESWWQGECEYNTTFSSSTTTAATGTTATGTSTASSTATATGTGTAVPNNGGGGGGGGGRGRTGTIVGAAVGGLAGTLAIGGLVFWLCRGGRKQVPDKDSAAAGAGGHGGLLGPDGRQIVEMGTDGGVQRVRPVEEVIAEMESPMEAPVGWGGAARGKVHEKA